MSEIDIIENEKIIVTISEDSLMAYINISPPLEDEEYTEQYILDVLTEKGITSGILNGKIKEILEEKIYNKTILVAKGKEKEDGEDGYFEFLFDTNTKNKPKILEDGSVDYSSIGDVETIEEGIEIVHYYPATKGEDGYTVTGAVLTGKPGKDKAQLRGKGFTLSEDKCSYVTNFAGRVSYEGDKIVVSNLFFVNGDVNYLTGNIDFSGDIEVQGNVIAGMKIRAMGNVTVSGYVEAADIIAGKDVILKTGMQGSGKGTIKAGGNVSGKFFEQVAIYAIGSVSANAMLNCVVEAGEAIVVSGKMGAIVGGRARAIREISATLVGNMAEVKTELIAGTDKNLYAETIKLEEQIKEQEQELNKISIAVSKLSMILKKSYQQDYATKRQQLLLAKRKKMAILNDLNNKKDQTLIMAEKTIRSKIVIQKSIYAGTMIRINGASMLVKDNNYYNVILRHENGDITVIPNV